MNDSIWIWMVHLSNPLPFSSYSTIFYYYIQVGTTNGFGRIAKCRGIGRQWNLRRRRCRQCGSGGDPVRGRVRSEHGGASGSRDHLGRGGRRRLWRSPHPHRFGGSLCQLDGLLSGCQSSRVQVRTADPGIRESTPGAVANAKDQDGGNHGGSLQ